MIRGYTIHMTSKPIPNLGEGTLIEFSEWLDRERGIVAPVPAANLVTGSLRLTASVDATTLVEALGKARRAFERAMNNAGVAGGEVIEAEIEEAQDDGDRHELVTGAEVARRVGISRERVRQLATQIGRFPPAAATVGGYRIWRWGDIADWAQVQGRSVSVARGSRHRSAQRRVG